MKSSLCYNFKILRVKAMQYQGKKKKSLRCCVFGLGVQVSCVCFLLNAWKQCIVVIHVKSTIAGGGISETQ